MISNKPLASLALIASLVSISSAAHASIYNIGTVSQIPGLSFAIAVNAPGAFSDIFTFNLDTESHVVATVLNLSVIDISLFDNEGLALQFVGGGAPPSSGVGELATFLNVAAGQHFAVVTGFSTGAIGGAYAVVMTSQPTAVPVPAAAWLLGSGLLGLVGVARRKED